MATSNSIKATITTVKLGHLELQGLMAEPIVDGKPEFYVTGVEFAEKFDLETLPQNLGKSLKRLSGMDCKLFRASVSGMKGTRLAIKLEDFEKLAANLAFRGNVKAQQFVKDLFGLSLHQLFCDAFGQKFEAADRQAWLQARQESKRLFWEITDQIDRWIMSRECSREPWVYYSNSMDAINRALFGKTAKQIREEVGAAEGQLTRDHFGHQALFNIGLLQYQAAKAMQRDLQLRPVDAIKMTAERLQLDVIDFKV